MSCCYFLVTFLLFSAGNYKCDGQLFDFFNSLNPLNIINRFRDLIAHSKRQLEVEIDLHKTLLQLLDQFFRVFSNTKSVIKDIDGALKTGSFSLSTIASTKELAAKFSKVFQQVNQLYPRLHGQRGEMLYAVDEAIKRIREIMRYMNADDSDLPPLLFEMINKANVNGFRSIDHFQVTAKYFEEASKMYSSGDKESAIKFFQSVWQAFKKLTETTKQGIETEMKGCRTLLAKVDELQSFTDSEEKKLDEMASSVTTLLFDLPNLYGKVKKSGDLLSEHVRKFDAINSHLVEGREVAFEAIDQILRGLSQGNAKKVKQNSDSVRNGKVSAGDREKTAFDQAFEHYSRENWKEAYDGLMATWRFYNETEKAGQVHGLEEKQIFKYLHTSVYKMGNLHEALLVCEIALARPSLPMEDYHYFKSAFDYYKEKVAGELLENMTRLDNMTADEQIGIAEKLASTRQYNYCHDENATDRDKQRAARPELFCRYNNRNGHPLLILSPVKEEIVEINPLIVVMYQVMPIKEAKELRDLAKDRYNDAQVVNPFGKNPDEYSKKTVKVRKAKIAWVPTNLIPKLSNRIEAYAGMNTVGDASEHYQVGEYGIGGHYSPHYDSMTHAPGGMADVSGDRIATFLLYLNDVEEGGGTVFNELGVRVMPQLGSGLLWYNFHKNETADVRMIHCGCPVTRGEKWVTNVWFRYRGQLLHKPCGLKQEDDFNQNDFDLPIHLQYTQSLDVQVPKYRLSNTN